MIPQIFLIALIFSAVPPIKASTITIPNSFYDHYWDNRDVVVDKRTINYFADEYCSSVPEPDAGAFFYGDLVLLSVDETCKILGDKGKLSKLLGDQYFAGYNGGTFFRDLFHGMDHKDKARGIDKALIHELGRFPVNSLVPSNAEKKLFFRAAEKAGVLINLSIDGSDEDIIEKNEEEINDQLFVFGYSQGFLQAWLEHSPYPSNEPYNPIICENFIDCEMANVTLELLEELDEAIEKLENPSTDQWKQLNRTVLRLGQFSFDYAYQFWSGLLKDHIIPEKYYDPVHDIGGRFLLVNNALVLTEMYAYAENNVDAGRCGVAIQAGVDELCVGYKLSLNCPVEDKQCIPKGDYPKLSC